MGRRQSAESSPRRVKLGVVWAAVALFVVTRVYLLFFFEPWMSDVFRPYFEYAVNAVDFGHVPYQAEFKIEYPPVAWWAIRAPRLVDSRRITNPDDVPNARRLLASYTQAFRTEMFACDLASFILLMRIAFRRNPRLAGWAGLSYVVTTALFGHLLYDRLDAGLLLLLMLWAFCWTRSLGQTSRPVAWSAAAYAFLGLSISFKLIPIIAVPFLLLSEWHQPRRIARLAAGMLALVVAAVGPFAIQYLESGAGVLDLFQHHAEREIQIESLYSTLMMIGRWFGNTVLVSHSHGAYNLSGDLSHAMKMLSTVLMFAFLGAIGLWALVRWSGYSRADAYRAVCYVIPATVILANVLSPQYFIWALPMLLLLAIEVFPAAGKGPWIVLALLVAVAVMTTWIMPYNYTSRVSSHPLIHYADPYFLSPLMCTVLAFRNFTYLGVVVWMGVAFFKTANRPTSEPPLPTATPARQRSATPDRSLSRRKSRRAS